MCVCVCVRTCTHLGVCFKFDIILFDFRGSDGVRVGFQTRCWVVAWYSLCEYMPFGSFAFSSTLCVSTCLSQSVVFFV